MSMYKDLVRFSNKYDSKMFSAYTRVWEIGMKLAKCWNKLGYNYPNPFCAEDTVLPSVELKQALQILRPYWKSSPENFNKHLDVIESESINIACDIIIRYIRHVCPKSISICIATSWSEMFEDFDYVYTMSNDNRADTQVILDSQLGDILRIYEGCDVWVECSRKVLTRLGAHALNYTIFNPYNLQPITKIMFTDKRDYDETYEDYLVVGWNSSVRQYSWHICDIRENVIPVHYMHFLHETDDEFEVSI